MSVAAVLLAATLVSVDAGRRGLTQMRPVGTAHIDLVIAAGPRLERGRLITVVGECDLPVVVIASSERTEWHEGRGGVHQGEGGNWRDLIHRNAASRLVFS
jgi:hypothetical protein